jgi:hypothetical protein
MKPAIKNLEAKTMTRRTVLGVALASAASSMVPPKVLAEIAGASVFEGNGDAQVLNPNQANLYAFPGVQPGTTIIAATWPVRLNRFDWNTQRKSLVTIHAGSQKWNVTLPGGTMDTRFSEEQGCRVFAGNVATQPGTDGFVLKAVVIEIPEGMLSSSGPMEIWAERVMHTGMRRRLGSPFLAALVEEDATLANSYHTLSPSDDRAMLTPAIANAIAAKARKRGMESDPDAHGRRLAARLLPDVLRYDPQMPFGFTFAAQNGHHPEELSDLVVDTILSGSPASVAAKADVRLQERFPFFSRQESVS